MAKLKRLGLASGDREDLKAVPLEEALRIMDRAWDAYFDYNQGPGTSLPTPAGDEA